MIEKLIEKLKPGIKFETYTDMCRFLNLEPPLSGPTKKYQVRELQRFFNWSLETTIGNRKRITITEIYEEPKPYIEYRGKNRWKNKVK